VYSIWGNQNEIDVFIPVHSDNIASILQAKNRFGKALDYMGNYTDYLNLHNKDVLQALARKVGIDTPRNYSSYKDAQVPFVVKPVNKSSAKGVFYFKTNESKNDFSIQNPENVIIQEYIHGFGCGYSVFVKNGRIEVGYGHKRLAEFPVSGGSSVYRTTFYDPRMKLIAEKIFQEVAWSGFAMIEFKYTSDNRLVLIEVNPRIWGSVNQGLQCGINFFEPIFGKVKFNYSKKEINTYLSPHIYISLIQYLFKLNFKPLFKFLDNIRRNKGDLSLTRDPKGFLSVIARKLLR